MFKFLRSAVIALSLLAVPAAMVTATTPVQAQDTGLLYEGITYPGAQVNLRITHSGAMLIVFLNNPTHTYTFFPSNVNAPGYYTFKGSEDPDDLAQLTLDFSILTFGNSRTHQIMQFKKAQ